MRVCAGAQGDGGSGCFEAVVTDVVTDMSHQCARWGQSSGPPQEHYTVCVFIGLALVLWIAPELTV